MTVIIIIIKVYFRPTTENRKAHIQGTSHDTGIDQTQIHKIIETGPNVCLTNSENKYTDKNDVKKLLRAAGLSV